MEGPPKREKSPNTGEALPTALEAFAEDQGFGAALEAVRLYEGRRAETSEEGEPLVLATQGLNGCTATVVVTQAADGRRAAQLAHYPPFMLAAHLDKIESLARDEDRSAGIAEALVYMERGRESNRKAVETRLRTLFGEDLVVRHETYKASPSDPRTGMLAVRVPSDPGSPVEYALPGSVP